MSELKNEISYDLLSKLFLWKTIDDGNIFELFHYYKPEVLDKVVTDDAITFRLSTAKNFDDKMEGKAIEVYYDLALEKLEKDKKINRADYERLSNISPTSIRMICYEDEQKRCHYTDKDCEEYIVCFSSAQNDPYMLENYGECCLSFDTMEFREQLLNSKGFTPEFYRILYGMEVVEHIEKKVMEVMNDSIMKTFAETFIGVLLHDLQFAAKRSKYAKENECRLVVYLPKDEEINIPNLKNYEEDGKRYLNMIFPKNILHST